MMELRTIIGWKTYRKISITLRFNASSFEINKFTLCVCVHMLMPGWEDMKSTNLIKELIAVGRELRRSYQ